MSNNYAIQIEHKLHAIHDSINATHDHLYAARAATDRLGRAVHQPGNGFANTEAQFGVLDNSLSSIGKLVATIQDDGSTSLDLAIECINAVANVTQVAAFFGPTGEAAAVVIGGICSIVGTIFGMAKPKQQSPLAKAMHDLQKFIATEFDKLEKIIEFDFERHEYHGILLDAKKKIGIIRENTLQLTDRINLYSVKNTSFDPVTVQAIQNIRQDLGVGTLAGLRNYVEGQVAIGIFLESCHTHLGPKGKQQVADFTCRAIYLHSMISVFRKLELLQLRTCYMWKELSINEAGIIDKEIARVEEESAKLIKCLPKIFAYHISQDDMCFLTFIYAFRDLETLRMIGKQCAPDETPFVIRPGSKEEEKINEIINGNG